MCRFFRKYLVFTALLATTASAQKLGFGVRGGVPLTDFLSAESKIGAITNVVKGKGDVILGPMIELRLPFGLAIEGNALYRRWDAEGPLDRGSASTWDFPIYAKVALAGVNIRPYAGGGINFQHLGDVGRFLSGAQVESNRRGFLGAGGVEIKIPFVRVSPEIRYTRWGSSGPLRSSNQLDFLIGLSF